MTFSPSSSSPATIRSASRTAFVRRATTLTTVISAAVVLAACGGKKENATQVAAKVNKSEISVHQINFVLQRQPGIKPDQAPVVSKRILEGLIDQELALQAAGEQKLDRDPRVVMAIEAAKREIIAKAFLDKLGDAAAKPNEDEITQYFNSKPALFSQRKIYVLREVNVEVPAAQAKELSAKGQSMKSDDFIAFLKAGGTRFVQRQVTQAPENLPLDLVDRLAATPEGRSITSTTSKGFSILYVVATKASPVTEDQARRAIEAFILNDRKRKLVAQGMKGLRESASISYLGQFAGGPSATAASATATESVLPADAAGSDALDDKALQKGLKGLK